MNVLPSDCTKLTLVEVPSKDFQEEWNRLMRSVLERDFRKQGYTRKEAKTMTENFINQWRKITGFRMKDS